MDADGQPACERCGRRLSRCKGKLYASSPGRCCHSCYNKAHPVVAAATPQQRTKRPYDSLGPTQRWKRRKQALADIANTLQQTGCSMQSLPLQSRPSAGDLIHLSKSVNLLVIV